MSLNNPVRVRGKVRGAPLEDKAGGKTGNIYIKGTVNNLFCSLMCIESGKTETSCSLRVPEYGNEFNERENLFDRGVALGELFGKRAKDFGYVDVAVFSDDVLDKGRKGVLRGFSNIKLKVYLVMLSKGYPHNGCRPPKSRRKKSRTKSKT